MWSQVPCPPWGTLAVATSYADVPPTIPQLAANAAGVILAAMAVMLAGELVYGSRRPAEVGYQTTISAALVRSKAAAAPLQLAHG